MSLSASTPVQRKWICTNIEFFGIRLIATVPGFGKPMKGNDL
jgi:hypothetical protein